MSAIEDLKKEIAALEAKEAAVSGKPLELAPEPVPTEVSAQDGSTEESLLEQALKQILDPSYKPSQQPARTPSLADKCRAIAGDESKPMSERIAAARAFKQEASFYRQYSDEDVVERLTPHPHYEQLAVLKAFIEDRPTPMTSSQVEQYIADRIPAIMKFNTLRAEFPLREAPILSKPDESVAYWAARQDPAHGKSRDTYCYALRRFGWKV